MITIQYKFNLRGIQKQIKVMPSLTDKTTYIPTFLDMIFGDL